MVSYGGNPPTNLQTVAVLILIVVEDGLVLTKMLAIIKAANSLNPYCSGRWSRTKIEIVQEAVAEGRLNPYCSGRWSRTRT